jgi:hypothetical protein
VIVAVHAERATGHEADSLAIIIDRAKWPRHRVKEIVADAGYASDGLYTELASAADHGIDGDIGRVNGVAVATLAGRTVASSLATI